jgi:hypothetical protein
MSGRCSKPASGSGSTGRPSTTHLGLHQPIEVGGEVGVVDLDVELEVQPEAAAVPVVVDDAWCFVGSANWDSRSFRLNFELNVEVYDPD